MNLASVLGDHGHEAVRIAHELLFPDAGDGCEFVPRLRTLGGHRLKGQVVEDHVRRDSLIFSQCATMLPQQVKQHLVVVVLDAIGVDMINCSGWSRLTPIAALAGIDSIRSVVSVSISCSVDTRPLL